MTEAEQMLIAAADLNRRACGSGPTVEVPAAVVLELAYFLETCGRLVARAGGIHATSTPAPIEHAHDIARTHLGDTR